MRKPIPIEVKKTCVKLRSEGKTNREIYDTYFSKQLKTPATYETFRHMILKWQNNIMPDDTTLVAGTYEGFTAHDATVQVSASGDIVQAWIKQKADAIDPAEFIAAVKEVVEPFVYDHEVIESGKHMLEIPLFDMHWGVAYMDHYKPVMRQILEVIGSHNWDRIVIPFGQDFFHNDSIVNGQTTKGTVIEKVDMMRAVKEAKQFLYTIIENAIIKAKTVEIIYTPGNHDRSISWMFMQVLAERYGHYDNVTIDDSLEYRKVITYGRNAVMITHGDSRQATAKNLAHIFPIAFATEFANADVREVHAGHLHHEAEADIYGVMVRRLSSGGKTDDWSNREDFIGAHKRFMLFEWGQTKLKSIHYI